MNIEMCAFMQVLGPFIVPFMIMVAFVSKNERDKYLRKHNIEEAKKEAYEQGYLRGTSDERQEWVYKNEKK